MCSGGARTLNPPSVPISLQLSLLPMRLAIVPLPPGTPVPEWTRSSKAFLSVTRTPTELSIVAEVASLPAGSRPATTYLAFRVRGPLPLDLVGVLAALATPLAEAGIPIFSIATHHTDYILIRERDAEAASRALTESGHRIIPLGKSGS